MTDSFISKYDPSRPTIGKLYRDLQMTKKDDNLIVSDLSSEVMKDFVTDVNDALSAYSKHSLDNQGGKPFYLMVHEKKDLQMPNALARRMIYFGYRPWPEDDTTVFYCDPKTQQVCFCWSLPHTSDMDNMLFNSWQFDKDLIMQIKAWKSFDLTPFGFGKHAELGWVPNPQWKDKPIESFAKNPT